MYKIGERGGSKEAASGILGPGLGWSSGLRKEETDGRQLARKTVMGLELARLGGAFLWLLSGLASPVTLGWELADSVIS